jgi:phage repressor protein C with HTH and peptisase S24 domain
VYALAGAGPARDLVEHEPIEMIVIPKSFWKPSIAAIKVRGRSMEPLILDGAYLGIDREDKWIISGEIYAVWIPYEGAVIKRLYIDPEKITLRSDNKDFPEFSIPVKEASAEMILGRVKWVLQQF